MNETFVKRGAIGEDIEMTSIMLRILVLCSLLALIGTMEGPRMLNPNTPATGVVNRNLSEKEQWNQAQNFLEDSLRARPNDPEVLSRYAKMLRLKGDTTVSLLLKDLIPLLHVHTARVMGLLLRSDALHVAPVGDKGSCLVFT